MSNTYSIVCDECKEKNWIGQSDYLYNKDDITKFLYAHVGHKIRFINDLTDDELSESYTKSYEMS